MRLARSSWKSIFLLMVRIWIAGNGITLECPVIGVVGEAYGETTWPPVRYMPAN